MVELIHDSPHSAQVIGGKPFHISYDVRLDPGIQQATERGEWEKIHAFLTKHKNGAEASETQVKQREDPYLDLLCATNNDGKSILHLAIESKRLSFTRTLFSWLPPDPVCGSKNDEVRVRSCCFVCS